MPEKKHYGYGRWPQSQFYAIVRSYNDRGRSPDWIAAKLGVTDRHVRQVLGLHLNDPQARSLERDLDGVLERDDQ